MTSSNSRVTSSNSQVMSSNPRVTCSSPRVTISNPRNTLVCDCSYLHGCRYVHILFFYRVSSCTNAMKCIILFYSVLFYSILFYSINDRVLRSLASYISKKCEQVAASSINKFIFKTDLCID